MISSSSIVKALTSKKGGSLFEESEAPKKLISFLEKNHLLGLLPSIVVRLEKHYEKEKKKNTVFLTTSHQFSPGLMEQIEERAGPLSGRQVEKVIDGKIIGGFKIRSGYKIIDGSVLTNIKILKESLLKTNG